MGLEIDGVSGIIKNTTSDGDITIKGNDGGSEISALVLDMSAAGAATFNNKIIATELDISGAIDVDGTTNLDVVDIDGAVDMASSLQVDGVITTSDGMIITTADNTDTLTLISTDADAASGPNLRLRRDSSSPADDDDLGHIFFSGEDAAGNETNYITFDVITKTVADGSENGLLQIKTMSAGTLLELAAFQADGIVFNERSNDLNFRVESNGNANMLFVDGGDNDVRIGTATTFGNNDAGLKVKGGITIGDFTADSAANNLMFVKSRNTTVGSQTIVSNGDEIGRIAFKADDGNDANYNNNVAAIAVQIDAAPGTNDTPGRLIFETTADGARVGTERMRITSAGTLGIHHVGGTDQQVRIENQNSNGSRAGIKLTHPSSTDNSIHLYCQSTRSSSLNAFFFANFESNGGADNEFLFRGDGNAFCDGSFSGGGADYAEYFEWKDGNSSDEDRRGYSVVLDGNKIIKATDSDDASKIIGVISANPAMIGDADIKRWKQKFLLDDYGTEITEEITVTEWTETIGSGVETEHVKHSYDTDRIPNDVTVPSDAEVKSVDADGNKLLRRKTNPDWNKDTAYISREDRKEWDTVGLMGKLRLKKGQPTGTNWIKMRDISDTVEEWLVR